MTLIEGKQYVTPDGSIVTYIGEKDGAWGFKYHINRDGADFEITAYFPIAQVLEKGGVTEYCAALEAMKETQNDHD